MDQTLCSSLHTYDTCSAFLPALHYSTVIDALIINVGNYHTQIKITFLLYPDTRLNSKSWRFRGIIKIYAHHFQLLVASQRFNLKSPQNVLLLMLDSLLTFTLFHWCNAIQSTDHALKYYWPVHTIIKQSFISETVLRDSHYNWINPDMLDFPLFI